jgi:putative colanic acid biosysnthesis UDP-glucose lipid carrier transferase
MSTRSAPLPITRAFTLQIGRANLLSVIEMLIDPLVLVITLSTSAVVNGNGLTPPYLLLSVIIFSLTFPGHSHIGESLSTMAVKIFGSWLFISALLVFFGYASQYLSAFDQRALINWFWLAPCSLTAAHFVLHKATPLIIQLQGTEKRAAIVGLNSQGIEIARTIENNPLLGMRISGFFDDRAKERLLAHDKYNVLGRIAELPAFAKTHGINVIYLSLPMATQPRILDLLDQLRDTTASIYFVPDSFVTDLIQGRMDTLGNIPVVAVCETPFTGVNGLIKRLSDVLLTSIILFLISPLLVAIAFGVKLSSPGPIIFRQRRYGLDGKEIIVYKFRSMTVCEDGDLITQARKNDQRVTALGVLLRRNSLDELPQFFNVLQGRMSIVGPRPHAVAHNEEYRGLIKGYMVRHKVKPGITGWAQVNGYRGETDTLEKMKGRIEFDLDYLRHWSLRFDLSIILNTILVLLKDRNAY